MGNISSSVNNINVTGDNNSLDTVSKFIPTTSVSLEKNSHVNEASIDITSSQYSDLMQYMHYSIASPEYTLIGQDEDTFSVRGYGLYPSKKSSEPSAIAGMTSVPLSGLTSIIESTNKLRNIASSLKANPMVSKSMSLAKKPYITTMKKIFDKGLSTVSQATVPISVNESLNTTLSSAIFELFTKRGDDDIEPNSSPAVQADSFDVSTLTLPTYSAACGPKPTSNVDSILTGGTTIPLSEYTNAVTSVAIASATTDYVKALSDADFAGATFSSPNIMSIPTNPVCSHVFNTISLDPATTYDVIDHLQVSGMKYGFKTSGSVPAQSVGTDTIQAIVDSAPVSSVSPFLNLGDLRSTQMTLKEDTSVDIMTVMLSVPKMVNANIIPEVNYYKSEDVLSIFDTIDIAITPATRGTTYFVSSVATSSVSNATAIGNVIHAITNAGLSVQSTMDNGFALSKEFQSYSSVVTIKFDFVTSGLDIPGYACQPLGSDAGVIFVPAIKMPGTRKTYKTTISTANLSLSKLFTGYDEMHFILGSAVTGPRVNTVSSCITINSATIVATPTSPTSTLPCWYYDSAPVHNALLHYALTVTPNYRGVSHPCDVTRAYSYLLAPYAPYIPYVISSIRESKFPLLEASFVYMCEQTFNDPEETSISSLSKPQLISWLCDMLMDLPDLMIYRGSSPFAKVESKHVPALAYKVLSILCAVMPVTAFMFPNNATLISAGTVQADYATHKDVNVSSLVDNDDNIQPDTEIRKNARLVDVARSSRTFFKSRHHMQIIATAGH